MEDAREAAKQPCGWYDDGGGKEDPAVVRLVVKKTVRQGMTAAAAVRSVCRKPVLLAIEDWEKQMAREMCIRDSSSPVQIEGGIGVGRVTKPGLDRAVGEAAINTVPRRMIAEAVMQVCERVGFENDIFVEIFVPKGEEVAAKTFNPILGIEGGISILGTSGIVEPMSDAAIAETIRSEIRVKYAELRVRIRRSDSSEAVSYTHLDVYKRQTIFQEGQVIPVLSERHI